MNDICDVTDLDREVCGHCRHEDAVEIQAPTEPGLYPDIPESVYHGDANSLSSTGVRKLMKVGGPAKFRFGVREDNDDFDIGTVAHTMLLGAGAGVEIVNEKSWQTAAARAARTKARAAGKVPLLTKQHAAVKAMVDAALQRPEVAELFPGAPEGVAEMSAYALDPETWVLLRARFDYLVFGADRHVRVRDYKTTKDASPRGFARGAADYGYHVQAAHYIRVLEALGYVVDEFVLLAQEKIPPYLTSLHEFDTAAIETGNRVVTAGAYLFSDCRDADLWPGYGDETNLMSLPSWASREW